MEENVSASPSPKSSGRGMGIAGLVLGILAAVLSFIPCVGTFAIVPGLIGVILSAVGMNQAGKAGASKSLALAGLICSIVGCCLACYQIYLFAAVGSEMKKGYEELKESGAIDSLNKAMEQLKNITDTLQQH
jgi:hypothetical protein